jgi:hypothetical protein
MPIALFYFSRKLKLSRFTIDVLMERLTRLRPPRVRSAGEWERFVHQTQESLQACDRLHQELGRQFGIVSARDAADCATLIGRFEDLHRRIAESIAVLNAFEHGGSHPNAV